MREAVSSGSATGHGDGPEPLWPRLASGDLRPAPAGIRPRPEGQKTPGPVTGDGHDTHVAGGVE